MRDAKSNPGQAKRRGRGFRHASETARKSLQKVAGGKGFAEAEVLLRWAEIVGADLAPRCRPVKATYGGAQSMGATLLVHAESGRAPEVEHLAPRIIERINAFYGYRAIARMRVTQSTGYGRPPGLAEAAAPFAGKSSVSAQEPSSADMDTAAKLTTDIASPGLRSALTRIGANVIARTRSGHISNRKS